MSEIEHPSVPRLDQLLDRLCEDLITQEELNELESLVLNNDDAEKRYLDYLALHGTLHWNIAGTHAPAELNQGVEALLVDESIAQQVPSTKNSGQSLRRKLSTISTIAGVLLLGLFAAFAFNLFNTQTSNDTPENNSIVKKENPSDNENETKEIPENNSVDEPKMDSSVVVKEPKNPAINSPIKNRDTPKPTVEQPKIVRIERPKQLPQSELVTSINSHISNGWKDAEIVPSPVAGDAEWGRRVYLDMTGRIPTREEATSFIEDNSRNKRQKLIQKLLASNEYARYTATRWSNMLVGRSPKKESLREPLRNYLAGSFVENRSWNLVVTDLITATGTPEENGATGFLLAHLNNDAVPATAVTARLLLGIQLQCVQCHPHPFNKRKQNEFWEFNAFFQDLKRYRVKQNGKSVFALKTVPSDEPVYFENRAGVMNVAFPKYGEFTVNVSAPINRRERLADYIEHDDNRLMAKAAVNRVWARYFGFGFTVPVDDLGSHNRPSHPELFELLTDQFVASGYNSASTDRIDTAFRCLSEKQPIHQTERNRRSCQRGSSVVQSRLCKNNVPRADLQFTPTAHSKHTCQFKNRLGNLRTRT